MQAPSASPALSLDPVGPIRPAADAPSGASPGDEPDRRGVLEEA